MTAVAAQLEELALPQELLILLLLPTLQSPFALAMGQEQLLPVARFPASPLGCRPTRAPPGAPARGRLFGLNPASKEQLAANIIATCMREIYEIQYCRFSDKTLSLVYSDGR